MNLFDKSKKTTTKKTAKTNNKVRVQPSEIDQDELFDMIQEMAELQKREKALKAKFAMINEEVKSLGQDEFVKLFKKNRVYPGSFMIEAINSEKKVAQVMFVPSDKYLKIDSEISESLIKEFGEEIVDENTIYSFDPVMLEKYSEEISEAIMNSNIPDEDKSEIIVSTTTYNIAKGTIEKLNTYGDVEVMLEKVKPVMSLKNSEVIEMV